MQDFKVSLPLTSKPIREQHVSSQHKRPLLFSLPLFFLSCSIPRLLIIPSLHSGKAAGFILGGAVKSF